MRPFLIALLLLAVPHAAAAPAVDAAPDLVQEQDEAAAATPDAPEEDAPEEDAPENDGTRDGEPDTTERPDGEAEPDDIDPADDEGAATTDETALPPDATEGVSGPVLWGGIALLVLTVGAGTTWFLRRRSQTVRAVGGRSNIQSAPPPDPRRGGASHPDRPAPAPNAQPAGVAALSLETRLGELEGEIWALKDRLKALESVPPSVATSPPATPVAPASPPPTTAQYSAPPVAARGPSDAVADAFVHWCTSQGPFVNKIEMFEGVVVQAAPSASVSAVFRDSDAPTREIRFETEARISPAEHWLVRVGGDLLLFPKPQAPGQFRDLSPVFEGTTTPQALRSVVPARVRDDGGGYVLTQPGRVA